jgi:hypothetical protein
VVVPARLTEVILGSRSPRRLSAWYQWALVRGGSTHLRVTGRADVASDAVEPMRLIANLTVDDIQAVEARLIAMETVWVRPVERCACGIIGTVVDPDGRYLQVLQR